MEGYVIITGKEDLKQIIREVFAEISPPKPEGPADHKYLNMDQLLDFFRQNNCRISQSQIYKLTRAKRTPHRKIGKSLLFNKEEILNWLDECKRRQEVHSRHRVPDSPLPQAKVGRGGRPGQGRGLRFREKSSSPLRGSGIFLENPAQANRGRFLPATGEIRPLTPM